jgi:hypothetical protein
MDKYTAAHIIGSTLIRDAMQDTPQGDGEVFGAWMSRALPGYTSPLEWSPSQRRSARRALMARHHPDKGGDLKTFQRISQAFESLDVEPESNPARLIEGVGRAPVPVRRRDYPPRRLTAPAPTPTPTAWDLRPQYSGPPETPPPSTLWDGRPATCCFGHADCTVRDHHDRCRACGSPHCPSFLVNDPSRPREQYIYRDENGDSWLLADNSKFCMQPLKECPRRPRVFYAVGLPVEGVMSGQRVDRWNNVWARVVGSAGGRPHPPLSL